MSPSVIAKRLLALAPLLFTLAAVGCATNEDNPASAEPNALTDFDGVLVTSERPEVGVIMVDEEVGCTGTLIRADILITAAHCVGFQNPGPDGPHKKNTFRRYDLPAGRTAPEHDATLAETRSHFLLRYDVPIIGWHVPQGTYAGANVITGSNDWMLMKLAHAVPGITHFATVPPNVETLANRTIFGGGHSWWFREAEGLMRKRPYNPSALLDTLGGDSGAPLFAPDGSLVGIHQGISLAVGATSTPMDAHHDEIAAEIAYLDRTYH